MQRPNPTSTQSRTGAPSPIPREAGSRPRSRPAGEPGPHLTLNIPKLVRRDTSYSLTDDGVSASRRRGTSIPVPQPPRGSTASDTSTDERLTDGFDNDNGDATTPATSRFGGRGDSALLSDSPSSPRPRQETGDNSRTTELLGLADGIGENHPQQFLPLDDSGLGPDDETPWDPEKLIHRAAYRGNGIPYLAPHLDANVGVGVRLGSKTQPKGRQQPRPRRVLQEAIGRAFVRTLGSGSGRGRFLPIGKLKDILTEEAVLGELEDCFPAWELKERGKLAQLICHGHTTGQETRHYIKIFALLAYIERTESFPLFVKEGVSDETLPLCLDDDEHLRRREPNRPGGVLKEIPSCLTGFGSKGEDEFSRLQWRFISPYLQKGKYSYVPHYDLDDEQILPFVALDNEKYKTVIAIGGFAEVFVAHIHPDHHDFQHRYYSRLDYAIKKIMSRDNNFGQEYFHKEVAILKKFKGKREHPHIVTLLATYKHQNNFHLVFYRADGNLFNYWETENPFPVMDYDNVLWMIRQCQGLADGLAKLHTHETAEKGDNNDHDGRGTVLRYGRHKDIKPENILWYSGPEGGKGTLKLSDFGASEFKSDASKSNSAGQAPDTFTYRSPERHLHYPRIGRSADIWSLACVFMQFVAWGLGGRELLEAFSEARAREDNAALVQEDIFFKVERLGDSKLVVMVKEGVTKFFDKLHAHHRCTNALHDFLFIIQFEMLIVEPQNGDPRRKSADVIERRLRRIQDRCRQDRNYAEEPRPWKESGLVQPQRVVVDLGGKASTTPLRNPRAVYESSIGAVLSHRVEEEVARASKSLSWP
ncbi:hypothetical protein GGS20DRAFT_558599 [Poronia punctata]|nr:hypothetical protein GGS20DRAFT_558599 [Poronia punctata]